jgi:flavin reductase (DIM6/NTAB) family NADH-FMN oxidoreductase RutF
MHEQVMYCGTHSGRKVDKFHECGLEPQEGRQTLSPILRLGGIHFECRIVFKAPMQPQYLAADYQPIYPEKDYHTLYFGEIQSCYETP